MSKADGFFAVRISLSLCALLTCVLWAVGQYPAQADRTVSGPNDLRTELRRAQLLVPPSDAIVQYDAGRLTYVPGPNPFEREFVEGLVLRLDPDGRETWPVTVYEAASRDTVFLNADGAEIGRLASDKGYDPAWSARFLFPGWQFSGYGAFRHDPSRVLMSARLVEPRPASAGRSETDTAKAAAGNPCHRTPSAPSGYKDYLVVWNSSSNIWLAGDSGTAAGVAMIDAGYSHGVALHDDGSVTRIGLDPVMFEVTELRFENAGATLASAGALGDTVLLGFDGALLHLSDNGELLGSPADAGEIGKLVAGTGFLLVLEKGGTVLSLGAEGELLPPPGLSGVAGIDAGSSFCVAHRRNGSLVAWGDARVATNIASGVAAVSASRRGAHCLALNTDGTVTAWGDDGSGQCRVPAGLSGVRTVAAGGFHSVALKSDGTVACWGMIRHAPPLLTNVVSVGASYLDAYAVTADGTVMVWGPGCRSGCVRISAKTPGVCEILDVRAVDCGIYMAVVRAREGSLEGGGGIDGAFLYGTEPAAKADWASASAAGKPKNGKAAAQPERESVLLAGGATVWDPAADFAVTNGNPNGVWTYGYMDASFGDFTPYTVGDLSGPENSPLWQADPASTPFSGVVWRNDSGSVYYEVAPGQLSLHPCDNFSPGVLRWTAPAGIVGDMTVAGQFFAGDYGYISVAVRVNGVEVWSALDAGSFDFTTSVAAGDTVDFVVYNGCWCGNTPLEATITVVQEHVLTVVGGTGGGVLAVEDTANVEAGTRPGYLFSCWEISPEGTDLGASFDASQSATSVTMPNSDVTLTAVLERNYGDSDGDGMADWWEADHGYNPLSGLTDSLVGWWQFREGSGDTSDDMSGHGNTAYILYTNYISWVTNAPLGAALHYDANTNGAPFGFNGGYVCVPGLSNAPVTSGFTVAAWVRANTYPSYATILTKTSDHDAWTDGFSLYREGGDELSIYAGDWNAASHVGSGVGSTGVWIHICGVYDGTNASIYINGQFRNTITNAQGSVVNSDPLWIGTIFNQSQWLWDGDIADVRFYTSVLSTDMIQGLLESWSDTDGDGLPNAEEYRRGTDPRDPASRNGTLFADSDVGRADLDGYADTVQANGRGPKARVQHAIDRAVSSGDVIELRGAASFADRVLSVDGKSVTLRPVGSVRF